MTKTFDQLIDLANTNLDQAEESDFEDSSVYANLAEVYALIAIAQELHQTNELANIVIERLDLLEAQRERLAEAK
jgi:hypothetical protein